MNKSPRLIARTIIAKSGKILRRKTESEKITSPDDASVKKPRFLRLKKIREKIKNARIARKNKVKLKKKRRSVLELWEQGFQGGFSHMAQKPAAFMKKKKKTET